MTFTDKQVEALSAPLDPKHIKSRSQAGQNLSYVEAWHVIAEANRIFGHDGWSRETVEMVECRPAELVTVKKRNSGETYDQWRVGFRARVRVTVNGCHRDGTGYGSGFSSDMGDAYESAIKEAEADATKRSLMTFGWPFGLALYDKSRENVAAPPKAPPRQSRQPSPPSTVSTPFDEPAPEKATKPPIDYYAVGRQKIRDARTVEALDGLRDRLKERRANKELTPAQFDDLWKFAEERMANLDAAVN